MEAWFSNQRLGGDAQGKRFLYLSHIDNSRDGIDGDGNEHASPCCSAAEPDQGNFGARGIAKRTEFQIRHPAGSGWTFLHRDNHHRAIQHGLLGEVSRLLRSAGVERVKGRRRKLVESWIGARVLQDISSIAAGKVERKAIAGIVRHCQTAGIDQVVGQVVRSHLHLLRNVAGEIGNCRSRENAENGNGNQHFDQRESAPETSRPPS